MVIAPPLLVMASRVIDGLEADVEVMDRLFEPELIENPDVFMVPPVSKVKL